MRWRFCEQESELKSNLLKLLTYVNCNWFAVKVNHLLKNRKYILAKTKENCFAIKQNQTFTTGKTIKYERKLTMLSSILTSASNCISPTFHLIVPPLLLLSSSSLFCDSDDDLSAAAAAKLFLLSDLICSMLCNLCVERSIWINFSARRQDIAFTFMYSHNKLSTNRR